MAEAVVSVIFEDDDDGKVYSIEWAELLGLGEIPIKAFSLIRPGMDKYIMLLLLYVMGM